MNGRLLFLGCACSLTLASGAVEWPKLGYLQPAYDSIYEPKVVAVPPGDGPGGLTVTPDGEIRAYGGCKFGARKMGVILGSRDLGLNWTLRRHTTEDGPLVQCPWADYRFNVSGGSALTKTGMCWNITIDANGNVKRLRRPVPGVTRYGRLRALPSRHRWVFAYATPLKGRLGSMPSLVYSDDDGATWSKPIHLTNTVSAGEMKHPDLSPRWEVGCEEPDLVELNDGTVMMIVRTSTDHHWIYLSKDGCETWGEPFRAPAFWNYNTMPLLLKLKDGRIVFFWNNTQILPRRPASEYPELGTTEVTGRWETVFTNRDALHAAISDDDGRTWTGFREIALNAIRNREDYRESENELWKMTGGGHGVDKSVHQAAACELPGGKIVILYGQSAASRRIAMFDVRWLYEKGRVEDFRLGTANISNHLYLKSLMGGYRGWSGHCSFNRIPGAAMVREPDTSRGTRRECLQICRIRDERLVDDHQGIAWNFPAAKRGEVSFECRIDGAGVRVSLCDHWINPCDWAVESRSPFSMKLDAEALGGKGRWTVARFAWDLDQGTVVFTADGRSTTLPLRKEGFSPFGISYLHLQTLAEGHDPQGAFFRYLRMSATPVPKIEWTRPLLKDRSRYIGWPTVSRTKKGELLAVFSGDREGHVCPYGKVQLSRSSDAGETWSVQQTICDGPLDDRDAGLVELSDGSFVLFWFTSLAFYEYQSYVKKHPEYAEIAKAIPDDVKRKSLGSWARRSVDGGKTWLDPVRVPVQTPHGGVVLSDGRIVVVGVQSSLSAGMLKDDPGAPPKAFKVVESRNGGRSFEVIGEIPLGRMKHHWSFEEPSLFESRDGTLHAYIRYEVGPDGVCSNQKVYPRFMYKSRSVDGGRTWSPLTVSDIDGFPPHFMHLRDGRILCSYGSRTPGRIGIYAAVSTDGGETFDVAHEVCLYRTDNADCGYPSTVENDDGSLLTVFYAHHEKGRPATLVGVKWRLE
ncbi:MAG: exo-alpha-sialidase [Kiritimatiellae bacterium]|nr:exo-alpha-sialidase [Kiritimatiellia bacterium]